MGVPLETFPDERRAALTPQNAALLLKKGVSKVLVERNAGAAAQFPDEHYKAAGATLVSKEEVYASSDVLFKVRPPTPGPEIDNLRKGSTLISFLYPVQNKPIVDALAARNAELNVFAMDKIPRISRAQVFDALRYPSSAPAPAYAGSDAVLVSSMANIAGYKAVLEASNHFGRYMTGQVTAAG